MAGKVKKLTKIIILQTAQDWDTPPNVLAILKDTPENQRIKDLWDNYRAGRESLEWELDNPQDIKDALESGYVAGGGKKNKELRELLQARISRG